MQLLHAPAALLTAFRSAQYADRHAPPGVAFARFGRHVGRRLVSHGMVREGLKRQLRPVSSTRYWEFAFTVAALPSLPGRWLDISSPDLFSAYTAYSTPGAQIDLFNPDVADVATTTSLVKVLRLGNIHPAQHAVDALTERPATYDCIWSISVVEHIAGAYDDTQAVRWMYQALRPGGRLILTVPVDRTFCDEYRERDYYGTQGVATQGRYFFQRWYDEAALWERVIRPCGTTPTYVKWWGERTQGHFAKYIERWKAEGWTATVADAQDVVDNYQSYKSWADMPGAGVAGIVLDKPSR